MTLFSALPTVVADGTLPRVSRNDIQTLTEAEFSAYDHWIFDKGGADGLIGIKNAIEMLPGDVTPTYGANYVGLTNGPADGFRVPGLVDTGTSEITMFAVMRQPVIGGAGLTSSLFGPWSGSNGFGVSASGGASTFPVHGRVAGFSGAPFAACDTNVAVNAWFFVVMSLRIPLPGNPSVQTIDLRLKVNNQPAKTYALTGAIQQGALPLAMGNYSYSGAASATYQYAEFGVLQALLTVDELAGLYTRSKARMAARGITI